ncbi:MAG TPA: hypothetical protein VFK13_11955 [Gemmatimonadaceae bacterium]|nr:hypothetical protein [Gemmatimonadaceae bacterium]
MMKTILLILLCLCLGYFVGFSDGRTHKENAVTRLVNRVGGSHRAAMSNDVDGEYDSIAGH